MLINLLERVFVFKYHHACFRDISYNNLDERFPPNVFKPLGKLENL